MTIIGEAELDIRAVGGHFTSDVDRTVKPGMRKAGDAAEGAAGRGKKAFSLMFDTIRDSASGAFAPITELMSHVSSVMEDLKAKSVSLKLTAAGAAGLGVGTGLQAFASKEQAAQAQLSDAISNTGHVYEEYGGQIEETVKHGEKFGVLSYQTMDVLNRLTLATNDPAKALKNYQVVLDMAAARHMSVTRAAQMLASAYGGNTRVFRMFGLSVTDQNKALAEAKKADDAASAASDKLKKARQNLLDVEARIGASRKTHVASAAQVASAEARVQSASASVATTEFKHGRLSPQAAAARSRLAAAEANLQKIQSTGHGVTKLTVSQQIELRKAHEAVTEALKNAKKTTAEKTTADAAAKTAAKGVDDIVRQLSDRLNGQAVASVDNFTGHMHALGAELEDHVSTFGAKYGPEVSTVSGGLMALGATMTIVQGIAGKFRTANLEAAASEAAVGDGALGAAGKVEAGSGAMAGAGIRNFGRLAGAVAGVALAIGTTKVASATGGQGAKGGAETSLMGAVSGAVIGLSIGGPMGAAIGGVAGALAGLALHFRAAAGDADKFKKQVDDLSASLQTALGLDKGLAGEATHQAFQQFLGKKPEFAHQLAQYGVSENQLIAYAQSGKESSSIAAAFGAANAGKFGGTKGRETFIGNINSLLQAYGTAADANTDLTAITGNGGKGTYNTKYPGMPPGWHPPMAIPSGYQGPGSALGAGSSNGQLTSIHMTLMQIQHNTAKGAAHTKELHTTVQRNGRIQIGRSPELATL